MLIGLPLLVWNCTRAAFTLTASTDDDDDDDDDDNYAGLCCSSSKHSVVHSVWRSCHCTQRCVSRRISADFGNVQCYYLYIIIVLSNKSVTASSARPFRSVFFLLQYFRERPILLYSWAVGTPLSHYMLECMSYNRHHSLYYCLHPDCCGLADRDCTCSFYLFSYFLYIVAFIQNICGTDVLLRNCSLTHRQRWWPNNQPSTCASLLLPECIDEPKPVHSWMMLMHCFSATFTLYLVKLETECCACLECWWSLCLCGLLVGI